MPYVAPVYSLPHSGSSRYGAHMDYSHTLGSALRQDETSRLYYLPGSFPPTTPPRVVVSKSPESRALSCVADLPGDSALYAVSVRRAC
jgi:hypothetical protein